jgi:hypothetical protein
MTARAEKYNIKERMVEWIDRIDILTKKRMVGSGATKIGELLQKKDLKFVTHMEHLRLITEQNQVMIEQNNVQIELLIEIAERKE